MRLLMDGWNVAITFSGSAEAAASFEEQAQSTLSKDAPQVCSFKADVRDPHRSAEIVTILLHRFGTIDGLVNNAGIRQDALMYNMTDEQWRDVLDTNLSGAWSMTKAVLPAMMQQRSGGIVNVASLSGLHGVVGQTN